MNKVLTISLHNTAYQLEEAGYEALQNYLRKAAAKLHDNPDKDEIMADFEEAIGDKCAKYLKGAKNVVTSAEIEEVLAAMGPVEDSAESADEPLKDQTAPTDTPKRLFKIRDGAVIEGVCNGLAAYANVDATIVRVAFIVLTVLTGGAWIVAYILMAVFMPEARTAEDIATAYGQPFNAKTLLDGARERYEYWKKFGEEQSKDWHQHKAEYKTEWRKWKHQHKKHLKQETRAKVAAAVAQQVEIQQSSPHRVSRGFARLFGVIGLLLLTAWGVAWTWAIIGVFSSGTIFGYFGGVGKTQLLLLLSGIFYTIFLPSQGLVSDAMRAANGRHIQPYFWSKFVAFLLWLCAVGLIAFLVNQEAGIRDGFVRLYQDAVHNHWLGL